MKHLPFMGAIVVAGVFVASPQQMFSQPDAQSGGQLAGQNAGRVRGGFGGQMGTPVQGTVTAVVNGKLTIKTDAGDLYDVTVTDTARIMENRQAIKLTDVQPGDLVMAVGQVDDKEKNIQAVVVDATAAAAVAKARENMGKTYITGRITAIDADDLKLTVLRTDHQSQMIAVDDGTSFQRGTRGVAADVTAAGGLAMGGGFGGGRGFGGRRQGGGTAGAPPAPESITLADIKVGDAVMATGTVKGGSFTATKMGISEPGAGSGEGGRRGPAGAAGVTDGPSAPIPPPQ